ncbi:MAX gene-associated protein [Liparis tanakae]|uniref:MAX gene-associated protein n=1 Tax=Liparis tanakae TaxID=230148 RepID=A0A4Z2FHA9_9TELE|nr:MAX gene-associated protein [Liparis tanakae]
MRVLASLWRARSWPVEREHTWGSWLSASICQLVFTFEGFTRGGPRRNGDDDGDDDRGATVGSLCRKRGGYVAVVGHEASRQPTTESADRGSALSSPAEASPAKPAATPPAASGGAVERNPATSPVASAADSLTSAGASLFGAWPPTNAKTDFPAVLTFKGVSVTLENNGVWKKFYGCGTEMILTKQGRRMFPYCRYRLSGLEPRREYSLVLSVVPSDLYKYRWSSTKWELTAAAEHQGQGLIRAYSHHYSPGFGSDWMSEMVSFSRLKLTNHPRDVDGLVVLHSMHRYIPRLHVIPVPDGPEPSPSQPVVLGPESMTFTFPQTEFMAVTTYQNFLITQLKIKHNPFAKGFREDGNNSRLQRIITAPLVELPDPRPSAPQAVVAAAPPVAGTRPFILTPAEPNENTEEVVDLR